MKQFLTRFIEVAFVLALVYICLALSGCSTANGICRDARSIAETGIAVTQNSVDKQRNNSIGFAIKEQTRVIRNGDQMRIELQGN